jgi:hypothetical protein
MSTANDDIETLLAAAPSAEAGRALLGWVKNLYGRIDRGDMMVGILSAAEVGRAPQALERAIDCGVAEARMALADWQASPPFGEPAPAAAVATLRAAIAAGVAGARLRLAQVQWFHRRDEASPAEQAPARCSRRSPPPRRTTRKPSTISAC